MQTTNNLPCTSNDPRMAGTSWNRVLYIVASSKQDLESKYKAFFKIDKIKLVYATPIARLESHFVAILVDGIE